MFLISSVLLNRFARSALSAKAISATAKRLLSDLGCTEGSHRQSLLTSNLDVLEMIKIFVNNKIDDNHRPKHNTLHPKASAFRSIVKNVVKDEAYGLHGNESNKIFLSHFR